MISAMIYIHIATSYTVIGMHIQMSWLPTQLTGSYNITEALFKVLVISY